MSLNEATKLRSFSDPLPELEPISESEHENNGNNDYDERLRVDRPSGGDDAATREMEMKPISAMSRPQRKPSRPTPLVTPKAYHSTPELAPKAALYPSSAVVAGEEVNDGESGWFVCLSL